MAMGLTSLNSQFSGILVECALIPWDSIKFIIFLKMRSRKSQYIYDLILQLLYTQRQKYIILEFKYNIY